MELTAKQLAQVLHGTVDGDPEAKVTTFAKIEHGKPGAISFFANPKYEQYVYTSKSSVLLVNSDFEPKAEVAPTMVRVENAYTAVAELLKYVSAQRKAFRRHRGRCRIAFSAKLGKRVWVGDFVTIGGNCRIGDCTKIYDNVTIGEGTVIGKNCIIHGNCCIGSTGGYPDDSPVIGDNVDIGQFAQILGGIRIADNVKIGAGAVVVKDVLEPGVTVVGVPAHIVVK